MSTFDYSHIYPSAFCSRGNFINMNFPDEFDVEARKEREAIILNKNTAE